jgi:short-subunit dehydrogenase
MKQQERIWIVGGSSGIGLELVKIFLHHHHKIIVSSRSATENKELQQLQKQHSEHLYLLNVDVTQDDFAAVIKKAWAVYDGLDTWFYNAGAYEVMDLNQWDKEKFIQMNTTNYLGVVKLMVDILPYFQQQQFGRWVWNLSLSTYFGLPKGGGYSAPKTALLNLAESIQPELQQENIHLQVINHGFVKTRLTAKNSFEMPQLMTPQFAAQKIYENLQDNKKFEIHFPFKLSFFLRVLSWLPYKISLALTKKAL